MARQFFLCLIALVALGCLAQADENSDKCKELGDKAAPYWDKKIEGADHFQTFLYRDARRERNTYRVEKQFNGDVPNFFTEEFMQKYNEDNKNEPEVTLYFADGNDCCKPAKAINAITEGFLQRLAADRKQTTNEVVKMFHFAPHAISEYLMKHMYDTCNPVVEKYKDHMDEAVKMNSKMPNFMDCMSPKFKDAVFRFKFCLEFVDPEHNEFANILKPVKEKIIHYFD